MNGDLNSLHTAISNANFDIGSFEEFSAKMQNTKARKKFFDIMATQNVDLGDYNQYESRLKKAMPKPDFADERDEDIEEDKVLKPEIADPGIDVGSLELPKTTEEASTNL